MPRPVYTRVKVAPFDALAVWVGILFNLSAFESEIELLLTFAKRLLH